MRRRQYHYKRRTRRTAHDHGPESDYIHSPPTSNGPNTGTTLARRRPRIRPHTNALSYHKETILAAHPNRTNYRATGGVRLGESIDPESVGTLEGLRLKGSDATPTEPPIHVSTARRVGRYRDITHCTERKLSAVVDGSTSQGPTSTTHMPPARQNPRNHDLSRMTGALTHV